MIAALNRFAMAAQDMPWLEAMGNHDRPGDTAEEATGPDVGLRDGKIAPLDSGPRDATRGGVNRPVLPGESPIGGKTPPFIDTTLSSALTAVHPRRGEMIPLTQ